MSIGDPITATSSQSYKASKVVNYDSRVVSRSNLLGTITLESYFTSVKCL